MLVVRDTLASKVHVPEFYGLVWTRRLLPLPPWLCGSSMTAGFYSWYLLCYRYSSQLSAFNTVSTLPYTIYKSAYKSILPVWTVHTGKNRPKNGRAGRAGTLGMDAPLLKGDCTHAQSTVALHI